MMGTYT